MTVDQKGEVYAVAPGTTIVDALFTGRDNSISSAQITVFVQAEDLEVGLSIPGVLVVGDAVSISASVDGAPVDASDIFWADNINSKNMSISKGKITTATPFVQVMTGYYKDKYDLMHKGSFILSSMSEDAAITGMYFISTISYIDNEYENNVLGEKVKVESSFDTVKDKVTKGATSKTVILSANPDGLSGSGLPKGSGNEPIYPYVTWSSSDNSIATVDNDGIVTGVSKGTAIISADFMNTRGDAYHYEKEIEVENKYIISLSTSGWGSISGGRIIVKTNSSSTYGYSTVSDQS